MSVKNSNDTIWNQTSNLLIYSTVPFLFLIVLNLCWYPFLNWFTVWYIFLVLLCFWSYSITWICRILFCGFMLLWPTIWNLHCHCLCMHVGICICVHAYFVCLCAHACEWVCMCEWQIFIHIEDDILKYCHFSQIWFPSNNTMKSM
jgi:hypothetical protein